MSPPGGPSNDDRRAQRPRRKQAGRGASRVESRGGERPATRQGEASVVERTRGVFMISVAAELAEMHPQTLRMYEARGLIAPKRSPKKTRLYSHEDVERLRQIQQMTAEKGLNLAGVEAVLELERRLEQMAGEVRRMRGRAAALEKQMAEVERARRSLRAEIVPYGAYEADEIIPTGGKKRVKIPIEKRIGAERRDREDR